MSRHPRILFPGALYHVTIRGNRRANIFSDAKDYLVWQDTLAEVVQRFDLKIHAFCLMPNHAHLLVETPEPNLPRAMHLLNGSYARRYNERHSLAGHLIQGRYHAVLIERESQLLETARYIALNPVRAELVASADAWRWSSHRYLSGTAAIPHWLSTEWILSRFAGETFAKKAMAYGQFVAAGNGGSYPLAKQSERTNGRVAELGRTLTLNEYLVREGTRERAMAHAYGSGAYTRAEIAAFFEVSTRTVSRAVAGFAGLTKAEAVSTFVTDPDVDTSAAAETNSVGINARKVV